MSLSPKPSDHSPFEFCRKITVSFVDYSKTDHNKRPIVAVILSCRNLLDFDMFLHLQEAPTPYGKEHVDVLARHLSSQPLRTLRIRFKWAKFGRLPISFTRTDTLDQYGLSFDILQNRLTHLSLELNYPSYAIPNEPSFSDFERLKSFSIYTPFPFMQEGLERISRLLQSVQVEEMGFSWPMIGGPPPLTLTKLSIITYKDSIDIMPILKQLVNLEIFTIKHAEITFGSPNENQRIQNQSVENEVIGCRRLRVLHLDVTTPRFFFQLIAAQCPLLSDLVLNFDADENDIFAIVDQCKALHSINLYNFGYIDNDLVWKQHNHICSLTPKIVILGSPVSILSHQG